MCAILYVHALPLLDTLGVPSASEQALMVLKLYTLGSTAKGFIFVLPHQETKRLHLKPGQQCCPALSVCNWSWWCTLSADPIGIVLGR